MATVQFIQDIITIAEEIHRLEFERYIEEHAQKISHMIDETFNRIQMESTHMDFILMVGGSSRIPLLRGIVEQKFPAIPLMETDIYSSVAYGLGIDD